MAAALAMADTPAEEVARQLYDAGLRQTQEGKLEAARLTLQTLVNTFPKNPLALQAKGAIDATMLFEEGQARMKAGKYENALLAFQTLIAVYPDNPLADRAKSAVQSIGEKQKGKRPVVKGVEFRDVQALSADEIRAAMDQREVRLSVGKPFRARDLEQAKTALEEILAEKGEHNARVQAETRTVPPNAVDVIFTVEKPRAGTSLLRSPFRIAVAGWHRVHPASSDLQNPGL